MRKSTMLWIGGSVLCFGFSCAMPSESPHAATVPPTVVNPIHSSRIGDLRPVPAGKFQRDSLTADVSVVTQPFFLSQNEITRSQFTAVLGDDPSAPGVSSGTDDPVQQVNWYQAVAFCNKLSLAEGLTPVYSVTGVDFTTLVFADIPTSGNTTWDAAAAVWTNSGYRLPTEAEWLWAAMGAPSSGQSGGTETAGYLKGYAGSTEGTGQSSLGSFAWYFGNSTNAAGDRTTRPVGTKTANELGLYDLSGNVWEWCWDWYSTVPAGTLTDYRGPLSGSGRVRKGGGWGNEAVTFPLDVRNSRNPNDQYYDLGFRVVRI